MNTISFTTRLAVAYETSDDVREKAKEIAKARLKNWRSVFDRMTPEQAAEIAASKEPATTGIYDPAIIVYEAAE
jgi:hypothetical protein